MRIRGAPLLLWAAFAALAPRGALAHAPGLSSALVEPDALVLTFSLAEVEAHLDLSGLDPRAALQRDLADRARLSRGGLPCALGPAVVSRVEPGGVALRLPVDCPAEGDVALEAGYLVWFNAEHRHLVRAPGDPGTTIGPDRPVAALTRAGPGQVARQFLALGFEHILGGLDHLVFLFGLVVVATGLRPMLAIATGFTIGHSLTLAASALGALSLPPAVVEPAIAASIALVGVENFWSPPLRRRLGVTTALGALHGFGFAGALAEIGLPPDARALALVAFNLGVEGGQLLVLAGVLPILLALRSAGRWEPWGPRVASSAVALAGLSWLTLRVVSP